MADKSYPRICLAVSVFLLISFCVAAPAKTIYVDARAAGANDGSSWQNAYVYLQEALGAATSTEKPVEIRIAQGIYRPNQGLFAIPEFDWRTATFQLVSGVALKGGYAGLGQPDPNARDIELYETILSGDLNGDDVKVTDPCDLQNETTRSENSYRVVTGDRVDETAVVDGLSVTGGNANGPFPYNYGGGMYSYIGSPTLTRCTLSGNSTGREGEGGAIYNVASNPTLTNCILVGNWANNGGGMYNDSGSPSLSGCTFSRNSAERGGAIYNYEGNPILTDCTFSQNSAYYGGGAYNYNSNPVLTRCRFRANTAPLGGGIYNFGSGTTLTNCIISGNSALTGGGIYNYRQNSPVLANCTFVGNLATTGSGLACFSSGQTDASAVVLTNCIFRDHGDEIANEGPSTVEVAYSDVQGGWPGVGNIDANPLFADPGRWVDANDPNVIVEPNNPNAAWVDGDYHLKSQAGRWDPASESWVIDDVTSPCIDAGDPNSDWSGETWPHGGRINMGAYGGTREASMSIRPQRMSLPRVAYIYSSDAEAAESFQSLLMRYGCRTTLVGLDQTPGATLEDFDLIIVGDDTEDAAAWTDGQVVAPIEGSGKPIIGLGQGGYDFFGVLELWIGRPNGGHGSKNSVEVIDPNCSLFSTPYSVDIPEDRVLQLYTETNHIGIYLWPTIPETVTVLASEVNDVGYFPLVMEDNRYLFWGFTESPLKMTEVGKTLFINVVIWTANAGWEIEI